MAATEESKTTTTTTMMMVDGPDFAPPSKRTRMDHDQLIPFTDPADIRTSSLPAPTIQLTGHTGSVYALSYSKEGDLMVSSSFDMTCLLWMTGGYYQNYNVLRGHKNAVLDVKFALDGEHVVTASADQTLGWWNVNTGERIKKLQGHKGIVNAVDTGKSNTSLMASASDDGSVILWDVRVKGAQVASLQHDYPVTAVAYGDTDLYSGGIDNCIHQWDLRATAKRKLTLLGHSDTITCLSLHPNYSTEILSYSMDGSLKSWNIRPFVENDSKRLQKTFHGGKHSAEKRLLKCSWSPDGSMVTAGSSDRMVHIWDELTTLELYLLPGHKGCVNTVVFHPKENVIASGSSDTTIYVGELGQ